MPQIVLVRSGDVYGPEYVSALIRQIHEVSDCDVVTLTDRECVGECLPLLYDLPGWWSKLELFAPENEDIRPCLFIDLDSFVFSSPQKFIGGEEFVMVDDFFGVAQGNSSVMWVPENVNRIWDKFIEDPDSEMSRAGKRGDQFFLADLVGKLWKTPESGITSYKKNGIEGPEGIIMQFHGQPKMKDANDWARDRWRHYTK